MSRPVHKLSLMLHAVGLLRLIDVPDRCILVMKAMVCSVYLYCRLVALRPLVALGLARRAIIVLLALPHPSR